MKEKKQSTNKELQGLIIRIGGTAIVLIIVLTFIVGVHVNHGNNMAPAMRDGDLVIINRLEKPMADSVVYYKTLDTGSFGRIIGVPGDIIYIDRAGKFTINGNVPQELIYYKTSVGEGITYPYEVPEGCYFILNDMRDDITDSRTFGAIPEDNIEGTVYLEIRRRGF